MDANRLAAYEEAFLALDWAVQAEEAGRLGEASWLRRLAALVVASVPAEAPAVDLAGDW
jgi:hypothetical protein